MKKLRLDFDKKMEEEVINDLIALKEKCAKTYKFTPKEKHDFFWDVMAVLSYIIEEKEKNNRKEKKMTQVRKTQIVVASKKNKKKPEKKKGETKK